MSCGYVTKHGSRGRGEHRPRGEQFATGGQRPAGQAARVLEVRRLHATRVRGREDDKLDLVRVACEVGREASVNEQGERGDRRIDCAGGGGARRMFCAGGGPAGPARAGLRRQAYTRSAPSATACEIGVLLTTPPS